MAVLGRQQKTVFRGLRVAPGLHREGQKQGTKRYSYAQQSWSGCDPVADVYVYMCGGPAGTRASGGQFGSQHETIACRACLSWIFTRAKKEI